MPVAFKFLSMIARKNLSLLVEPTLAKGGMALACCLAASAALADTAPALAMASAPAPVAALASTNAPTRTERGARCWTRADGVKLTGVFVRLNGDIVALKETGGRNVFWTFEQLSAGDRDYLAREKAVFGPRSALPQAAAPSRQQVVAQRVAQVAARGKLAAGAAAETPAGSAAGSTEQETVERASER